jgi:hypothetical protein
MKQKGLHMIKIENTEVLGWEAAIRGMRNPLNSWNLSDSYWGLKEDESPINPDDVLWFFVGDNDLDLMKRLRNAGTDHRKFMRMITVCVDLTAPLYWWKEFDTYKVGTVANSCSTMHKIQDKEFTMEDFSHEHLMNGGMIEHGEDVYLCPFNCLVEQVATLNMFRDKFLETNDKKWWWQMIQLLPSSYNQKRTVMLNYEVLANIYKSRKNHKLDEWHDLCHWIEGLPYSELITGVRYE